MRLIGGIWLATIGTVAMLAACAPVQSEPHLGASAALTPPGVLSDPTTPDSHDPLAAPLPREAAQTPMLGYSPLSADRHRGDASPTDDLRSFTPDGTAQVTLRLPIAADLGPNYFVLLAQAWDPGPSHRQFGQVSVAVVGFGFSERAKLRDDRVDRNGPLAAIARLTRHDSVESASRFAAAPDAAAGQVFPASGGAASQLGLDATLTGPSSASHELAPGLTATRTMRAGWFAALDESRIHSDVETWIARRDRTVLTVVLVWGGQVTDGWGRSLLQRLVQTSVGLEATRAP